MPKDIAERQYGFSLYQGGVVPGNELRVVNIAGERIIRTLSAFELLFRSRTDSHLLDRDGYRGLLRYSLRQHGRGRAHQGVQGRSYLRRHCSSRGQLSHTANARLVRLFAVRGW